MKQRETHYRTEKGGRVPLSKSDQRNLLALYRQLDRPVHEIADIYGVSTSTIYNWLPKLGVLPQRG